MDRRQTGSLLRWSLVCALPGVSEVKVNLTAGRLEVEYDPKKIDFAKITETVQSTGSQVSVRTRIGIENLRCASCTQLIEDELKSTPGVLNATVNVAAQVNRFGARSGLVATLWEIT